MAAGVLLTASAAVAVATPYLPTDDSTILERVPARTELERLAPLRLAVATTPTDLAAALALATAFIDLGRRHSDPRFVA
jgi:hypothetical protein